MSDKLAVWVIYKYPKEYPKHYVVRAQYLNKDGSICFGKAMLYDSLEEARDFLPQGLYPIQRDPQDDPVILEYWI